MNCLKLFLIILALIFPFNANSILHKNLSPSDTSCEELGEHVEGMELQNLFGGTFEILKIKNTKEVSRTFEKLICQGDAKLSNGTEGVYEIELYEEDGDIWYKVSPKLDFDFEDETSLSSDEGIQLECGSYYFTSLIGNCEKGYGEIIFSDNAKYIGEILDGQGTGIGKYVFEDGSYYLGEFIDYNFNGQGTLINSDGTQFIGYFENGIYQFGSQIDSGGITISDSYINDIRCGTRYYKGGGRYIGCTNKGVQNDENAEYHNKWGHVYYGASVDGKLTDKNAIFKFNDSTYKEYIGEMVDYNFEGKGIKYKHNGNYLAGEWSKNKLINGEYNCGINNIKKIDGIWEIKDLSEDEKQNGVSPEKLQSFCEEKQ